MSDTNPTAASDPVRLVASALCRAAGMDPEGGARCGYGWVNHVPDARALLAALPPPAPAEPIDVAGVREAADLFIVALEAERDRCLKADHYLDTDECIAVIRETVAAFTPPTDPINAPEVRELVEKLGDLHQAARGCEFNLVPTDGPIARLALFMHENGDLLLAALAPPADVPSWVKNAPVDRRLEMLAQQHMGGTATYARLIGFGRALLETAALTPPASAPQPDDISYAGAEIGEAVERLRIMAKQRPSTDMDEQTQEDADFQGAYDWFCDESRAIYATLATPSVPDDKLREAHTACEAMRDGSVHYEGADYVRGYKAGVAGCLLVIRDISARAALAHAERETGAGA